MPKLDIPIFDADGRVCEFGDELIQHFEGRYEGVQRVKMFSPFPAAIQDPQAAFRKLQRCAGERKHFVAVMLPDGGPTRPGSAAMSISGRYIGWLRNAISHSPCRVVPVPVWG